jgi:hypothetical protein
MPKTMHNIFVFIYREGDMKKIEPEQPIGFPGVEIEILAFFRALAL